MESANCRCVAVWLHHLRTVGCSAESLVYVGETTTSTQTAPNQMKMNAVIINLSDWNIWLFPSRSSVTAAAWLLCHYVYYVTLYVHVTARSIFDANISIWWMLSVEPFGDDITHISVVEKTTSHIRIMSTTVWQRTKNKTNDNSNNG